MWGMCEVKSCKIQLLCFGLWPHILAALLCKKQCQAPYLLFSPSSSCHQPVRLVTSWFCWGLILMLLHSCWLDPALRFVASSVPLIYWVGSILHHLDSTQSLVPCCNLKTLKMTSPYCKTSPWTRIQLAQFHFCTKRFQIFINPKRSASFSVPGQWEMLSCLNVKEILLDGFSPLLDTLHLLVFHEGICLKHSICL